MINWYLRMLKYWANQIIFEIGLINREINQIYRSVFII